MTIFKFHLVQLSSDFPPTFALHAPQLARNPPIFTLLHEDGLLISLTPRPNILCLCFDLRVCAGGSFLRFSHFKCFISPLTPRTLSCSPFRHPHSHYPVSSLSISNPMSRLTKGPKYPCTCKSWPLRSTISGTASSEEMCGGLKSKGSHEVYSGGDCVHMVNGFSLQCNTGSLLTTCPSPGEGVFIDEEAQDYDISYSFYMTTRSAIGFDIHMASYVDPYLWEPRSRSPSRMNGRFNYGGTATRRTGTNIFTRLVERTLSFPPRTQHIRDLNNDNPVRGASLFFSSSSRPLPTKPSMSSCDSESLHWSFRFGYPAF
jgi:hypothetical protein